MVLGLKKKKKILSKISRVKLHCTVISQEATTLAAYYSSKKDQDYSIVYHKPNRNAFQISSFTYEEEQC